MNSSVDNQEMLDSDAQTSAGLSDNTQIEGEDEGASQLAQAQEQLAYLAAEFENYKRQTGRRLEEERFRAQRRLLEELLPAIDNFALAQQYAGQAQDVQAIKTGFDFVAQQMETALQSAGLEPIEAVGQPFDPTLHDAIEEVEVPGKSSGTVIEQTRRGFRFGGQVLRHSTVKVAK